MNGDRARQPRPRLWVLNLDAELELAGRGGAYQTPQRVARGIAPSLPLARRLLRPEDAVLEDAGTIVHGPEPGDVAEPGRGPWLGEAWCPTPSALARLTRARAELPPAPPFAVLRRVNHRRFYVELGGGAPGARYVEDEATLAATLAEERVWLCKRPFGFAGRGQRRVPLSPSADDRRWLADSLRLGGFVAEPWLPLRLELGVHGLLDERGRLALGHPCVQQTNAFRAWVSTRRTEPGELAPRHTAALVASAERVAAALTGSGYFGPFGVDAYLYERASGALELNALSELNARYSMGFAVGAPCWPTPG